MNGKELFLEAGRCVFGKNLQRILLASTVAFLAPTINAKAQAEQDRNLCGILSPAILGGITGSWSISQGAGVAVAGPGLAIPLPPHPAQPMDLSLDGDLHAVRMVGGSPRQELLMLPVEGTAARMVMEAINAEEAEGFMDTATMCDTETLPTLVGSTAYSFAGHEERETVNQEPMYSVGIATGDGSHETFCVPQAVLGEDVMGHTSDSLFGTRIIGVEGMFAAAIAEGGTCEEADPPEPVDGSMVMTVVLKFETAERATGWLKFKGKQDEHAFAATAPLTMTR